MRVVLACLLLWSSLLSAAQNVPVFVLHAYSQEYPWTKRQHEGFVATLQNSGPGLYTASVEYLDTKRVDYTDEYAGRFAAHLAMKYRDYKPRVIYVTDDNALNFARTHLAWVFPATPVVFSGVNNYQIEAELDRRRFTGVFERKEIAPNLELMGLIAPHIRDVLVVGDESETYASIRAELLDELQQRPGINAHFISSDRLETLAAQLRGRQERFVFLTTLGAIRDRAGQPVPLQETLSTIVAAGRFTIFSMEDVYLQPGILGGYVTSGSRQGEAAAQLVLRYLAGTPIEHLAPLHDSPNEYLIDARELEATGARLPAELAGRAHLLNPLPSFFERNLSTIVTALYTLAVLCVALLVGSLIVTVRKNRQITRSAASLATQSADLSEVQDSLVRAQRIAGLGNWDWYIDENRLFWSEGIYRLFGIKPGDFEASYEGFLNRVHPDDRERVSAAVAQALDNSDNYDVVHRIVLPDGNIRVVRENAEIVRDDNGRPVRMIGTVLDITAQQRSEAALRESEAKLRTIVQGFPIILWVINRDGVFLLSEGKGLEAQNLRPGEVVGQSLFERYRDHPEIVRDARRALAGESFSTTSWMGDSALDTHYTPLRGANGEITGAIGVAADVTERKRTEDRLSFLANYDPVTQLPNRSLFDDRLRHAMQQADRAGTLVALLFLDLDNFKGINDTLGHSQGDELLRQAAQRLRAAARSGDTVSRFGGDEFTIVLENIVHEDDAARVAAEILQQTLRPYWLQNKELYVTSSIGIALYPRDASSAQALVMCADAAMYRAKEHGRNNFQFFDARIGAVAQERLALSTLLRGALERDEFSLHYQPQIDVRNGAVIGYEALLRWNNAVRGPVSPAEFIPILEETGMIVPVGQWVLREACRWAAGAAADGRAAVTIAVNISARQFRQPDLAQTIASVLADTELPPGRLELEITESSLLAAEGLLDVMETLKRQGVLLSIDDFGTGYSSLSYLKRFPVDRLKIDASFVRDVAADPDDAAIVTTIIGLARNLGLRVIAEGVETAQQLEFLQSQGCDEIQGYLIARPMPAAQVSGWWQAWCKRDTDTAGGIRFAVGGTGAAQAGTAACKGTAA